MLPLLYGVNKPFCRINFLFDKQHCLFLPFIFFIAAVIILQHVAVSLADSKIRRIFRVKGHFQFAIIIYYKKVRNHIALQLVTFSNLASGFWIQFNNLVNYIFDFFFTQVKAFLNFFVMLFRKFIKIFFYNFYGSVYRQTIVLLSSQLKQKTFL